MTRKKTKSVQNDLLSRFGIKSYKVKSREKYMSKKQLDHFKKILLKWKSQLETEAGKTVSHMKNESVSFADPNDRASQESDFGLELRTRDRERKLLKKIQFSLKNLLWSVLTKHLTECITNFTSCCMCLNRIKYVWHQILIRLCYCLHL